jgi:hypothetical protein
VLWVKKNLSLTIFVKDLGIFVLLSLLSSSSKEWLLFLGLGTQGKKLLKSYV